MDLFKLSNNAKGMQASEIRELMKLASKPGIITFAGGSPDGNGFPFREVEDIICHWTDQQKRFAFQYGGTNGFPPLLELLNKRLAGAGIPMAGQRVMVTTGAQQGLYLTAKALLNPGDKVLVESPSFIGALASFKSLQADLEWIPLEKDGMSVAEAEKALKRLVKEGRLPKFIYTIPNFQNPTGITLSQEKRKALLALSLEYGVPILEDDPYGELYFDGVAGDYKPIKALDGAGDSVIYLNTFSKILSPGMRLGWVTGCEAIISQLETAKQSVDACSSTYTQVIAADYLEKNYVEDYVRRMRVLYREKCSVMLGALKKHMPAECSWSTPGGGFFVWMTLPEKVGSKALFEASLRKNVAFVTGAPFCEPGRGDRFARLAFSNSTVEDIEKGVETLGAAVKELLAA